MIGKTLAVLVRRSSIVEHFQIYLLLSAFASALTSYCVHHDTLLPATSDCNSSFHLLDYLRFEVSNSSFHKFKRAVFNSSLCRYVARYSMLLRIGCWEELGDVVLHFPVSHHLPCNKRSNRDLLHSGKNYGMERRTV